MLQVGQGARVFTMKLLVTLLRLLQLRAGLGQIGPYLRQGSFALGVAAWMRYVTGTDEKGGAASVTSPSSVSVLPRPPLPVR